MADNPTKTEFHAFVGAALVKSRCEVCGETRYDPRHLIQSWRPMSPRGRTHAMDDDNRE